MKLAINLASRGRPELLALTMARTLGNIGLRDTVFMVSLDADDAPSIAAMEHFRIDERVLISIEDREDTVAAKWNRVLRAVPDADVYLPMCDDGPAITSGFDEKIIDAAAMWPDGIGVVFNHLENLSFTGIQAVTRRWARLSGYIYPEHFPYWFVDHWLSDVAEMTDRVGFADVRLDCSSNRPPTMEMREPAFWATFYDACYPRRRSEAENIFQNTRHTPDWQKAILRQRFPLVEQYSRMINDGVRAMQVQEKPADERYTRLKTMALALLRTEILSELEDADRASAA